jgi:hypothetical protein
MTLSLATGGWSTVLCGSGEGGGGGGGGGGGAS